MFGQSDEKLISKALQGDNIAWLRLVKRYESAIFHYALRMTGNRDDAQDLMQETFLSVYRSLQTYQATGSFKGWLFRIANFRCIELYRRSKTTQDINDLPEAACTKSLPDSQLTAQQTNTLLIAAMQQLPINQRLVVELKFFSQFTFDEIAEQLDISSNTAKSRLYGALAKLQDLMGDEYAQAANVSR